MDIFSSWLVNTKIAHRGLHNEQYPENSLGAFENAIAQNYAIELDVRQIDDGTVIVFHDDSLARMTGKDGYVCNLSLEEMQQLRLAKSTEKIPTFQEVLDLVAGRTPILVEIKNSNKVGSLEKAVLDMLKDYKGEFAVQSFNPYSLEYFKIHAPNILRGQLSCFFKGEDLSRIKKYVLKRMLLNKKVSKPDFIAYDHAALPNRFVARYSHLPILVWTIRSNSDYETVKPYCNNMIFEGFIPSND